MSKLAKFSKLVVIFVALFSFLNCAYVLAETEKSKAINENQLSEIQAKCSTIKTHLKKVRSNDALARVNLGQNYETMADKLMASLNARIATNKLNGGKLVEKTAEFNQNLEYFRENYQLYEKELVKLFEIDCQKSAGDFYFQLEKTRYRREELNYNTKKLAEIADEYKQNLSEFKKELK